MSKLTVKALEAAKPKENEYKLTVDRGLYLRVASDGAKTWLIRYVVDGKQRQTRLPESFGQSGAGFMSLAAATAENARVQALARDGVDFQEQRAATAKAATALADRRAAESKPIKDLFEAWLQDGVSRADGNAELRRAFEKDVLPAIGPKPVRDVTEHDLRALLRAMVKRGVHRMTVRVHNDLVQMFAWAEKRQPWRGLLSDGNPADLVEIDKILPAGSTPEKPRERVLSADELCELRDLLRNMRDIYGRAPAGSKYSVQRPLKRATEIALWISLSTACRIGELLMARWENVNLDTGEWFVPAENTKTSTAWTVFLSPFALRQFQALHELTSESDWCFPARAVEGAPPEMHVCVKSVSKQIGDRQTRFKQRSGPMKHRRHDNSLTLASGQNGEWTPHDLRRTAATMMQALGVVPDVIDRCQNHVLHGSRVRRHYLHYDYAAEKRSAWRRLGDQLDAILNSNS